MVWAVKELRKIKVELIYREDYRTLRKKITFNDQTTCTLGALACWRCEVCFIIHFNVVSPP